jgi:drug/metabolite transporter (DMT)-like permease
VRAWDGVELILLAAVWGASFLMMRIAVPEFGPLPMIALRTGIAALVLLPIIIHRRQWRPMVREWRLLLILAASNSALPFVLFAFAIQNMTAGFAAVLNATAPMFSAIIAWRWLGDRMAPSRIAGLLIGFAGVLVLVWARNGLQVGDALLAPAMVLMATCSYGFAANYARARSGHIDPLVSAAGSMLAATLLLLPLALIDLPVNMPSRAAWAATTFLGVICTGLAYVMYFHMIARLGATRAVAVTFLIPAFGMFWGWTFLDESISAAMLGGALVIVCGTALTTGVLKRPAREVPAPGK